MSIQNKQKRRQKRKLASRAKLRGTSEKPRICIYKSNSNLYAQLIDDQKRITLCSASTIDKDINMKGKCNKVVALTIGETFAKKALALDVQKVVFDRNGYQYHGVIKEFADACRKAGLEF